MASILKRVLVGRPLASADEHQTRLVKVVALAVFASDAISSTAYATEEILHVLVPVAGPDALEYLVPLSLIVMGLLAVVAFSYRQTIFAYPSGGGSYVVSKDNLGEKPALIAGSSLLVDYVLTVAVSISAGVAAITSASEGLRPYRVELCVGFIVVLVFANLRGLKESGTVFAIPTYVYILSLGALLVWGFVRMTWGDLGPLEPVTERYDEFTDGRYSAGSLAGVTVFLLMRAFSSGAVALTGVEAISNGVPAFKAPESKNAAKTLVAMAAVLGIYFFGVSVLAHHLQPTLSDEETVLSLLGGAVFGQGSLMYYVLQISTMAILLLAANTAFADFPRIASILARDGYLPRQLHNRGDRLVFSNGILALGGVAALLIVAFGGITTGLIPLYAVGVFCGFTLSQVGMVRHHQREQEPKWKRHAVLNAVGAVATFAVLLVVVVSKFAIGAWIPVVLIPTIAFGLTRVKRHYDRVARALRLPVDFRPASAHPHGRGAGRLVAAGHHGRPRLCPVPRAGPPLRLLRGQRARGGREDPAPVGGPRARHPAAHPVVALPGPVRAGAGGARRPRRRERPRHHHRGAARVRAHAVVGAAAAQPDGAGPQGPPAVPPQHRRGVGAVPHRARRGGGARPHRGRSLASVRCSRAA